MVFIDESELQQQTILVIPGCRKKERETQRLLCSKDVSSIANQEGQMLFCYSETEYKESHKWKTRVSHGYSMFLVFPARRSAKKKGGGGGGREVLLNDREGLRSTTTLGSIGRKPQICPKGMWESPSKKVMQPKA